MSRKSTAEPLLQQAVALHQQGQLDRAMALYDAVLHVEPRQFDALHMLGVIAYQTGNLQGADDLLARAIAVNAQDAACLTNAGLVLQAQRRSDAAVLRYEQAIAVNPNFAQAWFNLGNALQEQGQYEAAVDRYDHAIALQPDHALAHANRGNALLKDGRQLDAAIASYLHAIRLRPDFAQAHCNYGTALLKNGQYEAAIAAYDRAIVLQPTHADAHTNRGNALQKIGGRLAEAVASHYQAVCLQPDDASAWYNLGIALSDSNQATDAVICFDKAISLQPDAAHTYLNRGIALERCRQFDAAIASYKKALQLRPDLLEVHWNISLVLLLTGDLAQGFAFYEWGWQGQRPRGTPRICTQDVWLGQESLHEKTILLYAEQGFGDTFQFIRYATLLAQRGARVVVEVPQALVTLVRGVVGVQDVVAVGASVPPFDVHCPLMSLPLAFKTDLSTIPRCGAYLRSDPHRRATWADRLGPKVRPRIGLAWSGRPTHRNDHNRSIALERLLVSLPPGFDYVCLQKDIRPSDLVALQRSGVRDCTKDMDDFSDTAALCDAMDLVLCVDTSVAHLSAALGRPTWILLPYTPDWRWLLDRSDSPWYDTVQLFRQNADCDWTPVLQQVTHALARRDWRLNAPNAAPSAATG